jgi:hypothetical protein
MTEEEEEKSTLNKFKKGSARKIKTEKGQIMHDDIGKALIEKVHAQKKVLDEEARYKY